LLARGSKTLGGDALKVLPLGPECGFQKFCGTIRMPQDLRHHGSTIEREEFLRRRVGGVAHSAEV
jgi:hypothetical protein